MKNKAQHLQYNFDLKNLLILLISMNYPVPHSHKTFELGGVIIDSNFDSGNLFNAERTSSMMVISIRISSIFGLRLIIKKINIGLGSIFHS
jgi:hypothetical protein